MNFVYILYSQRKKRYYTGQTKDLVKRLERHNSGKVKSTALGMPWEIVWHMLVENRTEALVLEKIIKKRGANRFLQDRGVA